jgi:ABC-2 type transport system ATP-binding protein
VAAVEPEAPIAVEGPSTPSEAVSPQVITDPVVDPVAVVDPITIDLVDAVLPVATTYADESNPESVPDVVVSDVIMTATGNVVDSSAGSDPLAPVESPLSWALMAMARRQSLSGSISTTPNAAVTTSAAQLGGSKTITTNPNVIWKDGILTGNAGATSSKGLPLGYSVYRGPDNGGKLGGGPLLPLVNFTKTGDFTYVPYSDVLTSPTGTETFKIMAYEITPFDQKIGSLFGPLGPLLSKVIGIVHRIPIVGTLLSPLIGSSTIATFTVNPYDIAKGRPTDFTYKMASFDGTLISLNYFPAVNVANGTVTEAPTVLAASGLACAANTDPNTVYGQLFPSNQFGSLTPGIKPLRTDSLTSPLLGGPSYNGGGGYNVITWDPRGEFASQGQLQIDNPMFEGRDTSAIVSWLNSALNPAENQIATDPSGDPFVGITGGSYGGGIQLTTVDPRIEALIPEISWNSLLSSLYPNANQFKTGWGTILAAALAFTGARINPMIYSGIITGALTGKLTPSQQAVLGSVGPTSLLTKETAATFLMQGIDDTLFPLQEAVDAGKTITENTNVPFKMFWFCGGHGTCSIPDKPFAQDDIGVIQNLQWLDQYVANNPLNPADAIPNFQWYDQDGLYGSSSLQPFDAGFNPNPAYTTTDDGGFLGLWPILGGSNPLKGLPFSITNAAKARNAVNVPVTPAKGTQVVGSPTLSFSYSGLGTSKTVYAQLVDNTTGLVLSNNLTPVPVVLNGRDQTVEIPMENIAYTVREGDSLTLQITSSALNFENFWSYGFINMSDIKVSLPVHATNVP